MAITSVDGVLAGMIAPQPIFKVGVAMEAAGVAHSHFYSVGSPGAAVAPSATVSPTAAQIANPASKHCLDEGYKLVIRKDAQGGESGYCQFPDGTECEEWAYIRSQCQPGQVKQAS